MSETNLDSDHHLDVPSARNTTKKEIISYNKLQKIYVDKVKTP